MRWCGPCSSSARARSPRWRWSRCSSRNSRAVRRTDGGGMQLRDKVAIVCGAASGIGAAVAERFAKEGARILACGLPAPLLPEALACDVTDDAQVRSTVASALARHGRIDVLVNAAGVVAADAAATIDDATWQRMH